MFKKKKNYIIPSSLIKQTLNFNSLALLFEVVFGISAEYNPFSYLLQRKKINCIILANTLFCPIK